MKKHKEKKEKKIDSTNLDILPIRKYDDEIEAFILEDGKYFDMIEKMAEDVDNMLDDECQYLMIKFAKFLKLYKDDFTIVSLNFKTDLTKQKKSLMRIIENTNGNIRKEWLEKSIVELESAESGTKKREYYILYKAKDKDELFEKRKAFKILGEGVREMEKNKKVDVIFQLCNMNSCIGMEEF